jgi:deazaflavin-dependent oxidoreductase (nitroreductase family)
VSVSSVFSRLNPWVGAILRTPVLHWILSPALMTLSYTGRRSGRRITLPVGYRQHGDEVAVLVSEARSKTWWRNFREPREVDVRLRGRPRRGRAELVTPDDPFFRASVEEVLRRVPGMRRVFKVDYDRRAALAQAQLEALRDEIACVRLTLDSRI